MGNVTKHLETAYAEFERSDDEAALKALLDAWRERRLPRIAELVDRVSDRITRARDPIAAKSVKERTAKWIATAKKKDPADVGRLLATPWPGKWQDAQEVLAPLLRFPDDPRIALALAKLVDETPYDTWTSDRFYRPLLRALEKLLDPRTLPILEADLEREKSSYWRRDTRPFVAATVKTLKAAYPDGPPALSREEEAALAKLEGLFAGQVRSERTAAKSEEELLRAIYESPDDDDPRAVYADWLTERGDPRGEFITLQLARHRGEATDAMKKREAALLRKHGKAWAGELDRALREFGRVFERGFLAEGIIELEGQPKAPPAILSAPAWATLHTIELPWSIGSRDDLALAILSLPSMRWARTIRGVRERAAIALARQPPRPRLVGLEVHLEHDRGEGEENRAARRELADATSAFPNLTRLAIGAAVEDIEPFLAGKLARQLERLSIGRGESAIGELARAVERHGLAVPELRAETFNRNPKWTHWTLIARRDERGRFTRIFGTNALDERLPSATELDRALAALGPDDLTELTVDMSLECDWDDDGIEKLEQRFASFPALARIEVPWERFRARKAEGMPVAVHLEGAGVATQETLPLLWAHATSPPLSLSFDAYAVNYGAHVGFKKEDRLAEAVAILAKKRTQTFEVYRKGESTTCALTIRGTSSVAIRTEVRADPRFADEYVGWLARVLDDVEVASAYASFVVRGDDGEPRQRFDLPNLAPFDEMLMWIRVLGPKHADVIPFDAVMALAGNEQRGLAELRAVRTKRNLILVMGPTPERMPPDEQVEALESALCDALWSTYRSSWGFAPHDLAREMLAPLLAKHGFSLAELSPRRRAMGELVFACKDPSGARAVHLDPVFTGARIPMLALRLWHAPGDPDAPPADHERGEGRRELLADASDDGVYYRIDTGSAAEAAIKHIASRIEDELVPWFSQTEPPARPRRRR